MWNQHGCLTQRASVVTFIITSGPLKQPLKAPHLVYTILFMFIYSLSSTVVLLYTHHRCFSIQPGEFSKILWTSTIWNLEVVRVEMVGAPSLLPGSDSDDSFSENLWWDSFHRDVAQKYQAPKVSQSLQVTRKKHCYTDLIASPRQTAITSSDPHVTFFSGFVPTTLDQSV